MTDNTRSKNLIITEITDNENGADFNGEIKLKVSVEDLAILEAHADSEGETSTETIGQIVVSAVQRYKKGEYVVFDACESSWSLAVAGGCNDFIAVILD